MGVLSTQTNLPDTDIGAIGVLSPHTKSISEREVGQISRVMGESQSGSINASTSTALKDAIEKKLLLLYTTL